MKRFMKCSVATVLLMGGCSSAQKTFPRVDDAFQNDMDVGHSSFDLEHPDQAVSEYEAAYKRALLRDDVSALHDAGFNLAVARLTLGRPDEALETVSRTRADLALRGVDVSSLVDLSVVEAAAQYRAGHYEDALRQAAAVADRSGVEPGLRERAAFLAGLSADTLGRPDVVARSLGVISGDPRAPVHEQADHKELASRLDLSNGQTEAAWNEAAGAADLRRGMLDYRGMTRALRLAARAAHAAGRTDLEAEFTTRAAQSEAQMPQVKAVSRDAPSDLPAR